VHLNLGGISEGFVRLKRAREVWFTGKKGNDL